MSKSKGCDYRNKPRKLIVGVNDLATTHPLIAAQAHGWDPKTIKAGCNKKMQFRCKFGHLPKPQVVQNKVVYGPDSCAICSGQQVLVGYNDLATTHPKIAKQAYGWDPRTLTAGRRDKKQFRCKLGHLPKPVSIYVKAKYGPESCAICSGKEVLAGYNDLATTHPEIAKQAYGWDPRTVTAGSSKVRQFCCKLGHLPKPQPVSNKVLYGADSCAICLGKEVLAGYNDLATTHPEIAKQAYGWNPRTVSAGSNKYRQFRCKFGHLPKPTAVFTKVAGGIDSCRICSGQEVLVGFNDMQTTNPELARQLISADPTKKIAGTQEFLKWRCDCGHTWWAQGCARVAGRGCRDCAKNGFKLEKPSFLYLVQKHDLLKLGIGNHGSGRLNKHRQSGWELIEFIDMSGYGAWELEKKLKVTFKNKGIPLGQFRKTFPGSTESWYKHDLEVRTIRGLCRKLRVNLSEFLAM